ncbi:MAG: glycerol-3-phosphate acyltransferase [Planctomycetota bacterium]|nr:MAG: glycerol-3-phosphate acyltransferase [Planctomycetota bacterium]
MTESFGLTAAASVLGGYLLGSVPFGLLLGRWRGVDPRAHGSGNIGATNVLRLLGPGWGAACLLLDAGKGAAAVALARELAVRQPELLAVLAGMAAVLGHVFPVWLRGRGGKGVATTAGALLALQPVALLAALAAFAAVVALTRYVSLGSIAAALVLPFAHLLSASAPFGEGLPLTCAVFALSALVLVRHRANLARLRAGTEHRLGAPRAESASRVGA